MNVTIWCSACSAEPAVAQIEAEINGEWINIDVGEQCLTRLEASGKMEQ